MNHKTWICLFLMIVTFAVYRQVSHHEFVSYDDRLYVTENPQVKAGLTRESILWAFTAMHAGNWHPLTWLSHMLDVEMFGLNSRWHHLINLLFHVAGTGLLFFLLSRMTGAVWPSLFVAALFALHPLHVESVAWAAERKDVLSAFFWMLTLISYHEYVKHPGRVRYLVTLCAFVLGLMSKPMLVTLPFVLFLLDYWPLGRLRPRREPGPQAAGPNSLCWRLILEKIPFLALSFASGIITLYAQQEVRAVASLKNVPLIFRAVNVLWAYVVYLGRMIWPLHLAVIYPLPATLTVLQGLTAVLLLGAISFLVIRTARRHPYFLVGWLWSLVTLVPVIGLVQVGLQAVADRYTYIPLIGLFIMIAWGAWLIAGRGRSYSVAVTVLAFFILSAFGARTWIQLSYWQNSITLFSHAIDAVPDNYVAHQNLGTNLVEIGRLDEAVYHYSQVLRVWADDPDALIGMGNALARQGKLHEAVHYSARAVQVKPDSADAHFNLGFVFMEQGKVDQAIEHYSEGLRLDPGHADIQLEVGVALGRQGKLDESIKHFSEALRIKPDFPEGHYSLGAALARQGKYDESIQYFSEALRIKPDFPEARLGLEAAAQRKKKLSEE
ncbi:MAG: tetratricopeptide repeat protein [bacterium]